MTSKKIPFRTRHLHKFILPAIVKAGWDSERQVREQVFFTDGRIFVKGQKTSAARRKRADLSFTLNPISHCRG